MPDIDLFASKQNKQVPTYASWHPDAAALAVDAFSLNWNKGFLYIFPPFNLVGSVLAKAAVEQTKGILIVPE